MFFLCSLSPQGNEWRVLAALRAAEAKEETERKREALKAAQARG